MIDTYDRHRLVPGWSQPSLSQSTAVVIGVGALGNEVARILGMSGVGRLILCDPDRIESSNLPRTLLFRERDVGRFKAEAAADALRDLCPNTAVEARTTPLVRGVGLAELRDASLVVGCLDARSSRLQLAGRCQLVRARSIDAGTHPWGGEVRTYLDPDGPCYGCGLTDAQRAESDSPWTCAVPVQRATDGAAAPSSSVVGAWAGALAVRALLGLPVPAGAITVSLVHGTSTVAAKVLDPTCPFHHQVGDVRKLRASVDSQVGELLAEVGDHQGVLAWHAFDRGPARTSENLADAPRDARLSTLGVAPREILYVRHRTTPGWVELA